MLCMTVSFNSPVWICDQGALELLERFPGLCSSKKVENHCSRVSFVGIAQDLTNMDIWKFHKGSEMVPSCFKYFSSNTSLKQKNLVTIKE